MVSIALVGKWFRRRAGTAMGVFAALVGDRVRAAIFMVGGWVESAGWRVAWERVGWILLAVMLPVGWLFARSSPESMGVVPDEPVNEADTPATLSVGEALASPTFWAYSFAAALFNLTFSAVTIDNELLLREHGLAAAGVNERVLGAVMFAGLAANGLAGWLAKRIALDRLLAGGVALLGLSSRGFRSRRRSTVPLCMACFWEARGGSSPWSTSPCTGGSMAARTWGASRGWCRC